MDSGLAAPCDPSLAYVCDPKVAEQQHKEWGKKLINLIEKGAASRDQFIQQLGEFLASFWQRETRSTGETYYTISKEASELINESLGVGREEGSKIQDLIRQYFLPRDQRLYYDPSGGPPGTAQALAQREQFLRLQLAGQGGLLTMYVTLRGGSAQDIQRAIQADHAIGGVAALGAMRVAWAARARRGIGSAQLPGATTPRSASPIDMVIPANRAKYNVTNPRVPNTGETPDQNCVPCTAAMMKNQVGQDKTWTAQKVDPDGVMSEAVSPGRALKFLSASTGLNYNDKPFDLKNSRAVAAAPPGHYALIAKTSIGGHMVYAQKTASGDFVIFDAQSALIYTLQQFGRQYSDIAGYHFYAK